MPDEEFKGLLAWLAWLVNSEDITGWLARRVPMNACLCRHCHFSLYIGNVECIVYFYSFGDHIITTTTRPFWSYYLTPNTYIGHMPSCTILLRCVDVVPAHPYEYGPPSQCSTFITYQSRRRAASHFVNVNNPIPELG
jgi:hypothetical protein